MDKWITLHRKGQTTWVNFEQRMEMYFADGVIVVKEFTPFGDYFDESPDEILAMLNNYFAVQESPAEILAMLDKPDSELRQAAREVVDGYWNLDISKQGYCVLIRKLEALLGEK